MKRPLALLFVPLVLSLSACAVVGVKVDAQSSASVRRDALQVVRQNRQSPAAVALAGAQEKKLSEPARAVALLKAAEMSAAGRPGTPDHAVNVAATRGLLSLMAERDFAPLPLGNGKTLGVSSDGRTTTDPRTATSVFPADNVRITKLRVRTVQDGAGLACVAHFAAKSPALVGQAGVPPRAGLCEPVTALVRADGRNPQLAFYRTRMDDGVVIGGSEVELAADFSAPLAYMLSMGQNRNMDIVALLRSDRKFRFTGLYQFHRYDPEKIPVVFVHGLMSRPETWVPAVNELMADEEIRERYQFWFFLYPTGLPVWGSAAELRSEMDRYRAKFDPARRNRNFHRMVLAGHSMGGLISSLQIRTGGKALWQQFMNTPPYELSISPQLKERIVKIVQFKPRPEISRVVFFSTPHRGSELAVNPVAEFFSRLIKLPFGFLEKDRIKLQSVIHEQYRDLFVAPANSVVFLRANSPLLKSILALPMRPGVPFHSVIGDQGKGNTPDSSDGVVPYWSSHLDGAKSEKIVPSGHGSHENPEGISELRRILKLHL
ncbi:MAG: esterase/lipase family protein [Chthoniobacterales bacterium]